MRNALSIAACTAVLVVARPAAAQETTVTQLREELDAARSQIAAQQRQLEAQDARLRALESGRTGGGTGLSEGGSAIQAAAGAAPGIPGDPAGILQPPLQAVGEEPTFEMPQVAVLGDQGNVLTRPGQLTGELHFEYAHADRNRAIFRGVEVVELVLVGVFDINESRQDVFTTGLGLRYGLSSRLELGARLPYVFRSEKSVLAPIAGSTNNDVAATRDSSVKGNGIGDVELSARYQLTSARRGRPFLTGNVQVVAPTGSDPFEIRRDAAGLPLEIATGSGFWGISPSVTAILPSDPAVLFGTLGYSHNFARDVNARIGDVIIERIEPGASLSASAGLGVSLNDRTSFNFGYAHSWVMGSRTLTRPATMPTVDAGLTEATSRDLQIGRLLFGVTYRASDTVNVNWAVEIGATDDATDVRTVLRIPLVLSRGR